MKWTYEWNDDDAVIYDHNDEQVTKAVNSDPPSKTISPNGIPKDPDVRGAITDYLTSEIENGTWPSTDAKETYIRTAQTVLAAGMIEER
jgi:hypothetical protein